MPEDKAPCRQLRQLTLADLKAEAPKEANCLARLAVRRLQRRIKADDCSLGLGTKNRP